MSNLTVQQKDNLRILKSALSKASVMARIQEMIGRKADSYVTSVLQVVSNNSLLAMASESSIIGCVYSACSVNLPINNNLGLAYIVPFKGEAQLQIGYKGFLQLAQRSGQVKTIKAIAIYDTDTEDTVKLRLTSFLPQEVSGVITGYVAYLETTSGFVAHESMTVQQIKAHALKYSQTYKSAENAKKTYSVWHQNFDEMAKKTMIKKIMKYCPLSIELQNAMQYDQAVIDESGNTTYVDNQDENEIRTVSAEKVPDERFQEFLGAIETGNLTKEHALNPEKFDLTEEQRSQVVSA